MANEITMVAGLSANKGGSVVNPGNQTKQLTMANSAMTQYALSLTTAATLVSFPGFAGVPACVLIKNNDATNYIEVGGDSGLTVFKLKVLPGESVLLTPSSATMYFKANTASCNVFVVAVDS